MMGLLLLLSLTSVQSFPREKFDVLMTRSGMVCSFVSIVLWLRGSLMGTLSTKENSKRIGT